jgi:hypothetical protein
MDQMKKVENSIAAMKSLIEENNKDLGSNWRKLLKIGEDLQNNEVQRLN